MVLSEFLDTTELCVVVLEIDFVLVIAIAVAVLDLDVLLAVKTLSVGLVTPSGLRPVVAETRLPPARLPAVTTVL